MAASYSSMIGTLIMSGTVACSVALYFMLRRTQSVGRVARLGLVVLGGTILTTPYVYGGFNTPQFGYVYTIPLAAFLVLEAYEASAACGSPSATPGSASTARRSATSLERSIRWTAPPPAITAARGWDWR